MQDQEVIQPDADAAGFELGLMLGKRSAYAAVAGRCSAADAECMRRIRDQKLYLSRSENWDQFCSRYFGVSRAQANRYIRYLEEFGPQYFELTQLTRISPEQYRAIAPAIHDSNLHVNGEAIALIPENSERITAAVAELRQATAPVVQSASPEERIAALDRRFEQLAADFRELTSADISPAERTQMRRTLAATLNKLEDLRRETR